MRPRLPEAVRRAALFAFSVFVATATCACEGTLFPTGGSPSVGLSTTSTDPAVVGTPITFNVTASFPGNPANVFIKSIRVDFGDGQSAQLGATPGTVSYAYSSAGIFTASATVIDSNGQQGKASLTFSVGGLSRPPAPSVGFTSSAANPTPVGTAITFTVTASIPGSPANVFIQSIHVDFGDGQAAELGGTPGTVLHTYAVAGTFAASVTAIDTIGSQGRASLTIVVSGPAKPPTPSVGLTSTALNPTPVGTLVTFTVTASIPGNAANVFIQSIHIDFGDGQSADLGTPGAVSHGYSAAGTFTAIVTVTDTNGTQARASLTVVVK